MLLATTLLPSRAPAAAVDSSTTEAAVSSQLVSMPSTFTALAYHPLEVLLHYQPKGYENIDKKAYT
jgi:hypothetical protein